MGRHSSYGTIAYEPSDAERLAISVSFGCDPHVVPHRLTCGRTTEDGAGVLFVEMINGHRIGLWFAGRPALVDAVARATARAA